MTDSEYPWRDESLLYDLYWEQELSTVKIADKLGCSQQTVSKWMQRFDIPRRDAREAASNRRRHPAVFTDRGYIICASNYRGTTDSVGIHRLVLVAERGFAAVAGRLATVNQITAYTPGHERVNERVVGLPASEFLPAEQATVVLNESCLGV